MCDCYGEPCKVCGQMYPMHLGDFNTERWEITILCPKCFGNFPHLRRVCWSNDDGKEPLLEILSLTENAWSNRRYNHPNLGGTEIVGMPVHPCPNCSRLHYTKREAKECEKRDIAIDKKWNELMEHAMQNREEK